MKVSSFFTLAAAALVLGHPTPSGNQSLSVSSQIVERQQAFNCDPTRSGKSYSITDPIEKDIGVNCYHWPLAGRNGNVRGYRKCYLLDEPCNVKWRSDVRDFRYYCLPIGQPISGVPICNLLWEPDIESESYCGMGKEVNEDGKGNRVMSCGAPTGIGPDAKCRAAETGPPCPDISRCDRSLQPDVTCLNLCRGVWSDCEHNFVRTCPATGMPCQSNCGNPQTCIRGYPGQVKGAMAVVPWEMVENGEATAMIANATMAETSPEVKGSEDERPVEEEVAEESARADAEDDGDAGTAEEEEEYEEE